MPSSEAALERRALAAWVKRRLLPKHAAGQLLMASESLTLACLAALNRLREHGESARLLAQNRRLRIENAELRKENQILRSRLERIPPRERPHYTPQSRFQILEHMKAFLLGVEDAARRFLVTEQTLYNWLRELRRNPDARTIGSLLKPTPPLRRYHNLVRRLARQMKAFGFLGSGEIALTLARFGWAPSRRSVARFQKEREEPRPTRPDAAHTSRKTTVAGRYPNHLWLADITRIPTVFPFLHLHLAVVMDAFSRLPLQAALSWLEPSAAAILALVQAAIGRHGKPRHFVSDQGEQFKADVFRESLQALGIRQRFGALYQHGSIALIERLFRSLKQDLRLGKGSGRLHRPWGIADFERRLVPALVRYSFCRPHAALDGRVPIELYFRLPDQRPLRNDAPRGRPDDRDGESPFEIVSLDPEHRALPILLPKAA